MVFIREVLIDTEALEYLKIRGLEKQYEKARNYILEGYYQNVSLKIREPKKDKTWYFRINKQFRAICELEGDILFIFSIDNHQ